MFQSKTYANMALKITSHKFNVSSLTLALLYCITCLTQIQALNVNQKCQPTDSFFCNIPNYETVQQFNNTLGHTSLDVARSSLHKYAFLLEIPQCAKKVQLFLCSLYFPVCVDPPDMPTQLLQPCRDICDEARVCEPQIRSALNSTWPTEWDCSKFQYYTEEHKLCVINNQKEGGPVASPSSGLQQSTSDLSPSISAPTATPNDMSLCDQGLFDCRFSDPKRPLCIEMTYLCDGKRDCYRNDSVDEPNEGLDEANCKGYCKEGQLHCDDKCIEKYDICNGKVDCSSGEDEQDCIDSRVGAIQLIFFAFVLTSVVYVVVRFSQTDVEDKEQPFCESPHDIDGAPSLPPPATQAEIHKSALTRSEPYKQLQATPLPQPPLTQSSPSCFESTYQAASILTRSDAYDTARIVGDSSACSVYAYGPLNDMRLASTPPLSPPAPPSTPLYENPESPDIPDFINATESPCYNFVTGCPDGHIYVMARSR